MTSISFILNSSDEGDVIFEMDDDFEKECNSFVNATKESGRQDLSKDEAQALSVLYSFSSGHVIWNKCLST